MKAIDEDDFPDIIDIEPDIDPDDIIDDDDDEHWEKALNDIKKYIKQHKLNAARAHKLKQQKIKELRKLVKDLNLLLLSEAYKSRKTYAGFISKQDAFRRSILNSLLSGMSDNGKIIVVRDLLRELEGDTEPTEYYIW